MVVWLPRSQLFKSDRTAKTNQPSFGLDLRKDPANRLHSFEKHWPVRVAFGELGPVRLDPFRFSLDRIDQQSLMARSDSMGQ